MNAPKSSSRLYASVCEGGAITRGTRPEPVGATVVAARTVVGATATVVVVVTADDGTGAVDVAGRVGADDVGPTVVLPGIGRGEAFR